MTPGWRRALRKVFLPDLPDDYYPTVEEKLWLEEVEAMTDDDAAQMERFDAGTPADIDIWNEETGTWVAGSTVRVERTPGRRPPPPAGGR